MARIIPVMKLAWGLEDKAADDLLDLAMFGVAGHMHANNIASKLIKKNAMDEPIRHPTNFVSHSVIVAWTKIAETQS